MIGAPPDDAPRDDAPREGVQAPSRIAAFVRPSVAAVHDPTLAPVLAPLVDALVDAGRHHMGAMAQLESSVCAYVTMMREQGWTRAQIVEGVRALVGELRAAGAMTAAEPGDQLLESVIGWCGE